MHMGVMRADISFRAVSKANVSELATSTPQPLISNTTFEIIVRYIIRFSDLILRASFRVSI